LCPKCGQKLKKNGHRTSEFHAVFSDHEVRIQKHNCSHPECNWQSLPTDTSVFGTNIHPDLAKLQCEQGARYSYREAQNNLEKINCKPRGINNHTQVKRLTGKVGEVLATQNLQIPAPEECAAPATELIVQVDGGHIPTQEQQKRSFEALAAIVYKPESIREIDKNHRLIIDKTCVVSAQRGKSDAALTKLSLLRENVDDQDKKARIKGLYDYLKQNQSYLVNYHQRERNNQTYTSQVAESHIDSLINARHKRTGKCNGLAQEHTKSYKFEQLWLAITGNANGKIRFCQLWELWLKFVLATRFVTLPFKVGYS
jgi:hypothetical protein